jgi:hypothetical protein
LLEDTANDARARLDRSLLRRGQECTLQRLVGTSLTPISVTIRAHIRGYTPQEIVAGSGLAIGNSHVIMSSTEVEAAQWPSALESRIPRRGDRLVVAGVNRTVLFAWAALHISGELIRIEMAIQ